MTWAAPEFLNGGGPMVVQAISAAFREARGEGAEVAAVALFELAFGDVGLVVFQLLAQVVGDIGLGQQLADQRQ